ncbi:hypothetical protein F5B18DRAFT_625984 [Nemania serpens]|nr:hypothetical protein F5B18DRAFT_625984 [Nemania serpens]
MRLINVKTFKFEEFLDDETPSYAILSHTWGEACEELTVRDVQGGGIDKPGVGSVKFRGSCRQAEEDGYDYIWIDTCCIDKDSSAELSEAIQSMFRWYRRAAICYAYLSDVPSDDIPQENESKFRSSRWFRRGWTLQELLAPESLQFYDSKWGRIGNKGGMSAIIGEITGVPQKILLGIAELDTASVAQRMSWAARRNTKKKEDLAYCLLGIFDVTMSIIYGEGGDKAFFRLQDHIMEKTKDSSILAWGLSDGEQSISDSGHITPGRILAATPSDFANSGHIVSRDQPAASILSSNVSGGGSLRLHISLVTAPAGNVIGLLNCGPENDTKQVVGIPLARVMSALPDEYLRPEGYSSALQHITALSAPPTLIHVKNHNQSRKNSYRDKQYWLYNDHKLANANLNLAGVAPQSCWRPRQSMIISAIPHPDSAPTRTLARLRQNDDRSQDFVIVLSSTHQGTRTDTECSVMVCSRDLSLEELARQLQYVMPKASGKSSASNGLLHLRVELVPDTQNLIFTIEVVLVSHPPSVTVDATVELQKLELMLEVSQILKEQKQNKAVKLELREKAKVQGGQLQRIKREREILEDGLRQLREKMRILAEEEDNAAQEICHLNEEQIKIKERQEHMSKEWPHVWKRLDELYHLDENGNIFGLERMDGLTPLRWAVENGHVEMVELLLDEDANGAAATQGGWLSSAAASRKEYTDISRLLLATSKANADLKDGYYSQTPLICAAANDCQAVARLLLDTGKVEVDSKDNDGRTPLSWAAERGYENMVQLLLERGANADIMDKDTNTAYSYATTNGHAAIIHLFRKSDEWWLRVALESHSDFDYAAITFSPDSKLFASALASSGYMAVRVWDTATWTRQQNFEEVDDVWSSGLSSVAFSPDSRLFMLKTYNGDIALWNLATAQLHKTLQAHYKWHLSVAFSPDSKLLTAVSDVATKSGHSIARVWDVATGQLQLQKEFDCHFNEVAFSPSSGLLAAVSSHKTVQLWDTATDQLQYTLGNDVRIITFSPDSKLLATLSGDKGVQLWDMSTGQLQHTLGDYVRIINFSPDSKLLAALSSSKAVQLWDMSTGQLQQTLEGPRSTDSPIDFSPDSKLLVETVAYYESSSRRSIVQLWDIARGQIQQVFEGHGGFVEVAGFSPNSSLLVLVENGEIQLCDMTTTRQLFQKTFESVSGHWRRTAFASNSRLFALAYGNHGIQIWDTAMGTECMMSDSRGRRHVVPSARVSEGTA